MDISAHNFDTEEEELLYTRRFGYGDIAYPWCRNG